MEFKIESAISFESNLKSIFLEWMVEASETIEDQAVNMTSYETGEEYIESIGEAFDFSNRFSSYTRERVINQNMYFLFEEIQEKLDEFGLNDELEDLENQLFERSLIEIQSSRAIVTIEDLNNSKQVARKISDLYLQKLHRGEGYAFTDEALKEILSNYDLSASGVWDVILDDYKYKCGIFKPTDDGGFSAYLRTFEERFPWSYRHQVW